MGQIPMIINAGAGVRARYGLIVRFDGMVGPGSGLGFTFAELGGAARPYVRLFPDACDPAGRRPVAKLLL
jgi:hypothetical protein